MTYRHLLLPVDLTRATLPEPDALGAAVAAVAAPGAGVTLVVAVTPAHEVMARELPPAGPPDRPLEELLRERDRAADAFAASAAAAIARPEIAEVIVRHVEAPLVDSVLRLARDDNPDAIVLVLFPDQRRAWPRRADRTADTFAARAPSSLAVVAVRPPDRTLVGMPIAAGHAEQGARTHVVPALLAPLQTLLAAVPRRAARRPRLRSGGISRSSGRT